MKIDKMYVYALVFTILIVVLRFSVGNGFEKFSGNILSTAIFAGVLLALGVQFVYKKYDYFIMTWLLFYFSAPLIKLPFTTIGSLGILNGIFLPLMLLVTFKLKNKYLFLTVILLLATFLNMADVSLRIILSQLFFFVAPFIFFYFCYKKCSNPKRILHFIVFIAAIYIPLSIYQIIMQPAWGGVADWRAFRIFGNLFWHNSYSLFLLPAILISYALYKESKKHKYLLLAGALFIVDIFTFSRGGLFSLLAGLFIFEGIYKSGLKINTKKIVMTILLIFTVLFYIFAMQSLDQHLTPDTIVERTAIWDTVIPLIGENWLFGNGIGSYEIYRENILHSLSTHNIYLSIVFELGIIGLCLILGFIFLMLKDFKQKFTVKHKFRTGELGIALIGAILLFSLVGNGAFEQVISLNAWIALGCLLKYNGKE